MIKDYTRMAEGVTNLMAAAYDTERTEEYIERNYSMPEYNDILKYYYSLKENYPDIYYMYVYKFDPVDPHATVIIDLDEEYTDDPPEESIEWIGDTYDVDPPFDSDIYLMTTGKQAAVHNVKKWKMVNISCPTSGPSLIRTEIMPAAPASTFP
ncbi:MAG: hypothetical protein IJ803_07305 [Oribacterium sp.]|nr:hypothetical protein [Oribacterium sp.]